MANPPNLYASDNGSAPVASDDTRIIKQYWREIGRYDQTALFWHTQAKEIEQLYLDEDRDQRQKQRRIAIFWSNIETLKPAIYGKLPAVNCSRRYKDRDPVGRIAAELMERATNTMLEFAHADETFQLVRDDRLLVGRGTPWIRYEATFGGYPDEEEGEPTSQTEQDEEKQSNERLESEYVCVDYVHWKDFGHNVCRSWADIWLVWRIIYKTKDEVTERFGKRIANSLTYSVKTPGGDYTTQTDDALNDDHEMIYEVWDKKRNKVSWICEGLKQQFLDTGEPPLNFRDFFPCPKPFYATKSSKKLIPRPDYIFYRDQVKEINDLTAKIHNMCDWLIVKGFVPGAPSRISDAIADAVRETTNKEILMEVESWAEWTEKGGMAKLVDWLPLDMIIKAITAAIQARTQLIQDIFQITGISDIIRGQSDPNETLGAQTIKAQTSSRRISTAKAEMARVTRDCAALVAEVIAEKFEPENIAKLTGFTYRPQLAALPPQLAPQAGNVIQAPQAAPQAPNVIQVQQMRGAPVQSQYSQTGVSPAPATPELIFSDDVVALLRDDAMRNFRIDIETDSTVQADMQADQQRRTEFVQTVGVYLEKVGEAMQQSPALGEIAGELLMFAVRGFHVGRQMEDTIERAFESMKQQAQQAQAQPKPDPEMAKVRGQLQLQQSKQQDDAAMQAAEGQREQQNHQMQMQQNAQKFQMEMQHQQQTFMMEMRKLATEIQAMILEMQGEAADRQRQQAAATQQDQAQPLTA